MLSGDQARPNIRARGYCAARQHSFFDVNVMNPNSVSYSRLATKKVFARAELRPKQASYGDLF